MTLYSIRPAVNLLYGLIPLGIIGGMLLGLNFIRADWVADFQPLLSTGWWLGLIVLLVLGIYDGLQCRYNAGITMQRRVPHNIPVNQWAPVELTFSHQFKHDKCVELFDDAPESCEVTAFPCELNFQPGQSSIFQYKIKPSRRGDGVFGTAFLRIRSPLTFWQFSFRVGEAKSIKVYPNFSRVHQFSMLSMASHIPLMGIRKRQRRGEGLEFHQLREYRQGDSLRQVDWKATSKKRKLISREYQEERDQQIIFLVDSGRSMRAIDNGESHFDHALDALLLLSYIALKQGDAVGMYLPGANKSRYVAPKKGVASINGLLNSVYDIEPSLHTCDFSKISQEFVKSFPRRSLVVLLTNTRNEDFEGLYDSVSFLAKRHLVLLGNMREQALDDRLSEPVHSLEDALGYAGTVDYLQKRKLYRKHFEGRNIFYVDETPRNFAATVVNGYLDIKKSGVL
ncbi:MAG: DUF58 domain-containing protein [Gammaproteobacteria bacterium]|nr:MAG: DUF58 domain-containing protein [Gammaproteobacteria bacterium]